MHAYSDEAWQACIRMCAYFHIKGMMLGNWKLVSENGRIVGRTEAKVWILHTHTHIQISVSNTHAHQLSLPPLSPITLTAHTHTHTHTQASESNIAENICCVHIWACVFVRVRLRRSKRRSTLTRRCHIWTQSMWTRGAWGCTSFHTEILFGRCEIPRFRLNTYRVVHYPSVNLNLI